MKSNSISFAGVVLIGGQSTRMHTDKSLLLAGHTPLYKLAAEKLVPFCNEIYLSVNEHQSASFQFEYPIIKDIHYDQGPAGGILSCFESLNSAMIILACDMPFILRDDVAMLISLHSAANGCTVFYNLNNGFYDPLLSIWESDELKKLKAYFTGGGRSLQQYLKQNNIAKHFPPNPDRFKNINTPEGWAEISSQI